MIQGSKQIMVAAGEASGDLYGSNLAEAIRKKAPSVCMFGIGGTKMQEAGVELYAPIERLSSMGLTEILGHLPYLRRLLSKMAELMDRRRPDLLILIDYPGFNLRLAGMARKRRIPVLYYICPKVWAWGAWRIPLISRRVTKLLAVFPFEPQLFHGRGLDVMFIGHPLLDVVSPSSSKTAFFREMGLPPDDPVIGLLPGSRPQEVERLYPVMIQAARIIEKHIKGVLFLVGKAHTVEEPLYARIAEMSDMDLIVVEGRTYDIMKYSDLLLVASGTATMEAAIVGTPMVILYKMAPLSYLVGRIMVHIPYIGLPNIVSGREIVPELIQGEATPYRVAAEALAIWKDGHRNLEVRRALAGVKEKLGRRGASERAAHVALEMLEG